jgi:replicative DNA helicase
MRSGTPVAEGLPPCDISAEEAVIAAILLDQDAIARVRPLIEAKDFFREQSGWCYAAACALDDRSEPITIPMIAHELADAGKLDAIGGEPWLVELAGSHFTSIGVEAHAGIVARTARYRLLLQAGGQIAQLASQGGPDASHVLAASIGLLNGLVTDADTGLEKLGLGGIDDPPGTSWGIPILDRRTMGMRPGEMMIVAGGVGEGKSMLAGQIARNVAERGGRVVIWSTEMTNHRYELRMAHAISAIRAIDNMYDKPHTPIERESLAAGMSKVNAMDIFSASASGKSVGMISAATRLLGAKKQVDLVVVDYLQQLSLPKSDTDAGALKSATGALKRLAIELGCAVIVVSQTGRAAQTEMRGKESAKLTCVISGESYPKPFKEAMMGGAIEADADLIVQIQRHFCQPPSVHELSGQHMQIVITKNRNGREGGGMAWADFGRCRFLFLTQDDCYRIAGTNMGLARALLVDQGFRSSVDSADYDVPEQQAEAAPPATDEYEANFP